MKLYLATTERAGAGCRRLFAEFEGRLVDLRPAYAARAAASGTDCRAAYEMADYFFPASLEDFLARGKDSRAALEEVAGDIRRRGLAALHAPSGQRIDYGIDELRLLPPLKNPSKSFVIGFSDRARIDNVPAADIPTAYYKLPQTFVTDGAPIIWPRFSKELDVDACIAVVIGKAGRRIKPEQAWEHIAGATLLIDVTARDINRREGATTNNLLGKNFPSSTCLGRALLLTDSRREIEGIEAALEADGESRQQFSLSQCVFSVAQIVARWSILGIAPGDFLAIGASMARAGDRLGNPAALHAGATIRCAATAIGALHHRVVSAGGTAT
ncbi:MAG: fumarylacetoacetate hydrolase family protein [Alphaproteobacteria bacterium]